MMVAQKLAFTWAVHVYGAVVRRARYQAFRLLEETLELAQSLGLSRADVIRTVDWVFGRPVGAVRTEIGDVRLTLDILAESQGHDGEECYAECMSRIAVLDPAKMRAKDDEKIDAGLI